MLPARVVFVALAAVTSLAGAPSDLSAPEGAPALSFDALGRGTAPLDGPWRFHVGDHPAWEFPKTGDATGSNGRKQLSPDKTRNAQSHPAYTSYARYRKHVHFIPAPGVSTDLQAAENSIWREVGFRPAKARKINESFSHGSMLSADITRNPEFFPQPVWPPNDSSKTTEISPDPDLQPVKTGHDSQFSLKNKEVNE